MTTIPPTDSPFAPPAHDAAPPIPEPPRPRASGLRALRWAGIAVAAWLPVPIVMSIVPGYHPGLVVFGLLCSVVVAVLVAGWGMVAVARGLRETFAVVDGRSPLAGLIGGLASVIVGGFCTLVGLSFPLFLLLAPMSRGRQLRRASGRRAFAGIGEGERWFARDEDPVPASPQVAHAWRKNGLTEHASVAAFARLAVELVELGAPPALIAAAHRDALDELAHTRLCFSLAYRMDGQPLEPTTVSVPGVRLRWAPRVVRLARLAVESLLDGGLTEGVSARNLAGLARRDDVHPAVREVVAAVARDEGRHAAHALQVVDWCVAEGGTPVVQALRAALTIRRPPLRREHPEAADGQWEPLGLPSRAREEASYRIVYDRLVKRTQQRFERGHASTAA